MIETMDDRRSVDRHLGCFGEYDSEDGICRRLCALRLRCAIEHDQNIRLELLEDLMSYEEISTKMQ